MKKTLALAVIVMLAACSETNNYIYVTPDAGQEADAGAGAFDAGVTQDSGWDAAQEAGLEADLGSDAGQDAGRDLGVDSGTDAGSDAGRDLGADLGVDAGTDAGPADAGPPPAMLGSIVISEVYLGSRNPPPGRDGYIPPFIEIYNRTSRDVGVGGLRITLGVDDIIIDTLPAGTVIQAYHHYLIGTATGDRRPVIFLPTRTDSTAAKCVTLYDGTTVVDTLGWDGCARRETAPIWGPWTPNGLESFQRKVSAAFDSAPRLGEGYDTDDNSNDFFINPMHDPQNSLSPAVVAVP